MGRACFSAVEAAAEYQHTLEKSPFVKSVFCHQLYVPGSAAVKHATPAPVKERARQAVMCPEIAVCRSASQHSTLTNAGAGAAAHRMHVIRAIMFLDGNNF